MIADEDSRATDKSPTGGELHVYCLNCGETFDGREKYQRHNWSDHAGEVDLGEKAAGRSAK
jgi:hypothetical protein